MTDIAVKVIFSLLIVAGVIFFMWRMPVREGAYFTWAPLLAIGSVWSGLASLVGSLLLFTGLLSGPDQWLVILFLLLDPFAIAGGVLTLWIYRRQPTTEATILAQKLQARVGIVIGLLAVAVGYVYVMTHKTPFSTIGI